MMVHSIVRNFLLLLIGICLIASCASHNSRTIIPDYNEKGIRLVGLLPVKNKTKDKIAAQVLRETLLEELYFKGYPKIPLGVVDEKLIQIYGDITMPGNRTIPPEVVGEVLGVDAVMYCTLGEWNTSFMFVCAPTTVAVSFELRSAKTGETLWKTHCKVVKRNYGFTEKELEMKSCETCELAILEVVNKAIATLPNGPDFPGSPSHKKTSFLELW
jgi:hypothetical protein